MKVYFILISIILCISLNFYIFKNNKKKFIIGLFLTVSILFFTYNFKSNIGIFDYASSLEIDLKNSSELDPIKLILFLEILVMIILILTLLLLDMEIHLRSYTMSLNLMDLKWV